MKMQFWGLLAAAAISVAGAEPAADEHALHSAEHAGEAPPASMSASTMSASMMDHMKDMDAMMDKLAKTRDSAERRKLMEQHHQAMRQQLDALRHMKCSAARPADPAEKTEHDGMMGGGMMMSGEMMKCRELMQTRLNMTIELMDHMMQEDEARNSPR